MLDKPQITLRILIRKSLAFLGGFISMGVPFFYLRDSFPLMSFLFIFPGLWLANYFFEYFLYDIECKKYDVDLRLFYKKKFEQNAEKVQARQGGNVNDNIASYKKNNKKIW